MMARLFTSSSRVPAQISHDQEVKLLFFVSGVWWFLRQHYNSCLWVNQKGFILQENTH